MLNYGAVAFERNLSCPDLLFDYSIQFDLLNTLTHVYNYSISYTHTSRIENGYVSNIVRLTYVAVAKDVRIVYECCANIGYESRTIDVVRYVRIVFM